MDNHYRQLATKSSHSRHKWRKVWGARVLICGEPQPPARSSALLDQVKSGGPTYHRQSENIVDITIVPWLKWESASSKECCIFGCPSTAPPLAPPMLLICGAQDVAQTWFQCRHYVTLSQLWLSTTGARFGLRMLRLSSLLLSLHMLHAS